jgi:hypothetical protein
MEDRYYASMQQPLLYDDDDFGFAPQRYKQPKQPYEQQRQPRYNMGLIVDYIDHEPVVAQLRQLLQAAPPAHALAPPALHQVQPPAASPLNLGNNAVAPP